MPSLTKVWFEIATLRKLSSIGSIVGVKDSSGDLDYFDRLCGLKAERVYHVLYALVALEASEADALQQELADASPETEFAEVSRAGSSVYAAVLFMKSDEAAVAPVLKRANARWATLAGATGTPADAVRQLASEVEELTHRIESLKEEAAEIAGEHQTVLVALDESAEDLAKKVAEEKFATTRETFLVEGWMRGRDEERVRKALAEVGPEIEMIVRDPNKDENVPIDLRNSSGVSPFEFVTTLYGRPAYWERDPTPLLAPFFIIFFSETNSPLIENFGKNQGQHIANS